MVVPLIRALFFIVAFATSFACSEVDSASRAWPQCIIRIGDFFSPVSLTEYNWRPNECGFKVFRAADIRKEILFRSSAACGGGCSGRAVAFAGDSTGLRDFTQAVNMLAAPVEIKVIYKVATVPSRWPIFTFDPPFAPSEVNEGGVVTPEAASKMEGGSLLPLSKRAVSNFTYYNMRYAYFAENVLREEIRRVCLDPRGVGGFFFVTLGNWDLNWKTHKKEPVPGLSRKFDFGAATDYWVHYIGRMFVAISEESRACRAANPSRRPPTIIVREQFMPNCAASRFSASKHRRFKRCASFLVPTVVPMYRRVLRGVGWAMNVPVVPTDHMFREGYRYCGISDGLHLDGPCMDVEQQLLWNVAALVADSGHPRQEWGALRRGDGSTSHGEGLWESLFTGSNATEAIGQVARRMVNASEYEEWMAFLRLKAAYDNAPISFVIEGASLQASLAPRQGVVVPTAESEGAAEGGGHMQDGGIVLEVQSIHNPQRAAARPSGLERVMQWWGVVLVNIVTIALIVLVLRELRKS